MVVTTIRLTKPGLLAPVYLAGTFTDWQPVELNAREDEDGQYIFHKDLDVSPGEHQYKFRLGHGDWWITDTTADIMNDESGNQNNRIVVSEQEAGEQDGGASSVLPYDVGHRNGDVETDVKVVSPLEGSHTTSSQTVPDTGAETLRHRHDAKTGLNPDALPNGHADRSIASETRSKARSGGRTTENDVKGPQEHHLRDQAYHILAYWCISVPGAVIAWILSTLSWIRQALAKSRQS